MKPQRFHNRGFTLVEMAVVLVIIGIILAGVLNARAVLRNAHTKDIIKAFGDMATAAQQFRDRYGMWPGDYNNAVFSFPGLTCTDGNGNGTIDAAESACASQQLVRSSMLRGDAAGAITVNGNVTLSLTSRAVAVGLPGLAGLPTGWINVVRIQNIDCDIAIQLDRALDDGDLIRGNFRVGTACTGQNENVVVANAVMRLN